jgi:MSHA pilin protein MshD
MRVSLRIWRRAAAGFSLIEVIVFIVIVGAALAGVLSVLNVTASRSADPFLMKQSFAIGEAFIDEILSRDYSNPGAYTTSPPVDPRSNYADVSDYDLYSSTGITTRATGAAITGLTQYSVTVSVAAPAAISGAPMKRITVTVTDPSGNTYPFTAYKADY